MHTSSKLIQKYYYANVGHKLSGALKQVDIVCTMMARLLGADFVAVFYRAADGNPLVPVSYYCTPLLTIDDLGALESSWAKLAPEEIPVQPQFTELSSASASKPGQEDVFAKANRFGCCYQFPHGIDDHVRIVSVAYWLGSTASVDLEAENLLHLAGDVIAAALTAADRLKVVEKYSTGISELLPVFEIPLAECEFPDLVSNVMMRIGKIIPEAAAYLLSRDAVDGKLTLNQSFNAADLSDTDLQFLISQLPSEFSADLPEDTVKYRCRDLNAPSRPDLTETVSLEIAPDEKNRFVLVVCGAKGYALTPNDRELLSLFAVFAQTTLRNALLVKRLTRVNTLLEESRARLANTETTAALADMTAGLAHEFNNIFGGVIGRLQLLKLRLKDDTAQADLAKIESQIADAAAMIRRIQQFTTSTRPKSLTPVLLSRVVKQALKNTYAAWSLAASRRGVTVELTASDDETRIDGSQDDLITAVEKLLENAIEYAPENSTVRMNVGGDEQEVTLSVSDDGAGIPAELQAKVFYPFFTTKRKRGAGLGLAIVRGIVGCHRGSVAVAAPAGVGTTFTLTFPGSSCSQDATDPAVVERKLGNRRVLVVDDDAEIRSVLKDMLTIEGHQVVACADAHAALDELKSRGFDVLLTDLGMPGMSGLELAAAARRLCPELPIVMITGWGTQLDQDEIAMQGITAVLSKPFHMHEVKHVIANAVGSS